MSSKGFSYVLVLHFGGLGVAACSLDAVLVPANVQPSATVQPSQPLATVCNPLQATVVAESYRASAQGVIFGGFQRCVIAFRAADVGLRGIEVCLVTCRTSFCVVGTILLRCCQTMCCIVRGKRSRQSACRCGEKHIWK